VPPYRLPYRCVMSERDEVVGHYENIREEDRISSGLGQLELLRVREVLLRHLPSPPARVLDVGGGTGVHASWLADRGDAVHVIDLAPRHVEMVRSQLGGLGVTAEVGDARTLNVSDASFDVALVFGPMYHLTTLEDRQQALREAVRAVRPGGLIAVAAVNRFASLFDGLARGFLFDAKFRKIVERDLAEGQHRNPDNLPHWFTTAYLHEPEQLRGELEQVDLDVVELVGLEGLAGWLHNLVEEWETDDGREIILFAARTIERTPSLLGLSAHLLAVTRTRG
jgi:ubiquinone/menaquinone biosynthesis C-methylase UbiE